MIELVVVIAVIAILAAVSVVSYIAITNKAKQSADEQAVRQMNTILTANDVMGLRSINDVFAAFEESDLSIENYKPIYKDRFFFWDADANRIVYTDSSYKVIFPEDMKGVTKDQHQWYSLTQSLAKTNIETATVTVPGSSTPVPVKSITEDSGTKHYDYAVATPEQLYTVGQEMKDAMKTQTSAGTSTSNGYKVQYEGSVCYIVGDVKVVLTQDLDLMGGSFNFCVKGNFVLDGNGYTIKGIVNNFDFIAGKSKTGSGSEQQEYYGSGIVGYINQPTTSTRGSALFKNVTIENCLFGDSKSKGGSLVGYAGNSDVVFDNVTVKNCNMEGFEHSIGGFVGDTQAGVNITLKNANKLENCSLKLYEGTDTVKECYGAGYFIGRQTKNDLVVTLESGASFSQSGNSKTYDSSTKKAVVPSEKEGCKYWDDAVESHAKSVAE